MRRRTLLCVVALLVALLYATVLLSLHRRVPAACAAARERAQRHPRDAELQRAAALACGAAVAWQPASLTTVKRRATTARRSERADRPSTLATSTSVPRPVSPRPGARARPGRMVSDAEIAAYNSSWSLSCDALRRSAAVRVRDRVPFARGFAKAAWRAEARDGSRQLVLKRAAEPDTAAGQRAFFQALKQELKFAIRLGRHPRLLEYYGSCHSQKSPDNVLAVEGPLVAWRPVVRSRLSWSARLRLARDVAELLTLLADRALIHCDWKADQIALTRDLRVRLVDLKSLRYYVHEATPWLAQKTCVRDSDCQSQCFKWLAENDYDLPDAVCNSLAGMCRGFNAQSMAHASAQLFFYPLLQQHRVDAPKGRADEFDAALQRLLDGLMAPRNERWTAPQLEQYIDELQNRFDAQAHYSAMREQEERLIADIGEQFWASAEERCGSNRFC